MFGSLCGVPFVQTCLEPILPNPGEERSIRGFVSITGEYIPLVSEVQTDENTKLEDWSKMATGDVVASIDTSRSIQSYTVPTADTIAAQYIMKNLVQINHSPMLCGLAGFGKT